MKKLNLNAIRIDGGTQPRERIDMEAVGDYAEAVKVGIEFPPVIVFHDGADHWLADGFHRWHAHKSAEKASILADIRAGSLDDAKLFASGCNGDHGLRRSNADKRLAVLMALGVKDDWSDTKLAAHCAVSVPFVSAIRRPAVAVKQQEHRAATAEKKALDRNPITPPQISRVSEKAPAKPAAAPAADDAFSGFDPIAELESTQKLLEAADKRIESLTKDDMAAELNKQVGIRQGIEARLSLEMTKVSELQRELDSYGKWYAELRKVSGLQKRSDITKLVREAANSKSEAV